MDDRWMYDDCMMHQNIWVSNFSKDEIHSSNPYVNESLNTGNPFAPVTKIRLFRCFTVTIAQPKRVG